MVPPQFPWPLTHTSWPLKLGEFSPTRNVLLVPSDAIADPGDGAAAAIAEHALERAAASPIRSRGCARVGVEEGIPQMRIARAGDVVRRGRRVGGAQVRDVRPLPIGEQLGRIVRRAEVAGNHRLIDGDALRGHVRAIQ